MVWCCAPPPKIPVSTQRRKPVPVHCAWGSGTNHRGTVLSAARSGRIMVYIHLMALNIKNPQVEKLAAEVARLAQETKTEAIRRALLERKARLQVRGGLGSRKERLETL